MILNIGGGGGLPIRLIVTAPTGSAVSVTQGTTVLAANEVDGVWTFAIPSLGVWTIHATIDGQSLTQDVDISKVGQYNVTLEAPVKTTLNDNDWATIKSVADESKGANYWAVGDTKQITINGKLSDGLTLSNYQTWVYIIGFDHNKDVEGTGITFQGFKTAQTGGIDVALCDSGYNLQKTSGQWFNMNNSNSNTGGWKNSRMRSITLPVVEAALPSELTSVLKTTTIYSDNTGGGSDVASYVTATQDELYLLAAFEIFGVRTRANSAEQNYQQQYAYYVAGNSKIKYRHSSTATAVYWWERSVHATNVDAFCRVNSDGTGASAGAIFSDGLAPAFKVGGAKYTPLDYITATGTQYIDTGLIVNKSDSYRMVLDTDLTSSENYAGCNGYMQFQANVGEGTRSTIDITYKNITETIMVNGTQKSSQSWSSYSGANVKLGIFKMGDANNTWFNGTPQSGKLYSCKIYKDDVLVRDMIPAKDEVGNVGLYDKVEGKFYYNVGTGSFGIPGVRQAGTISVGQSLYCEENGVRTEYILVHQGNPNASIYDSTCNGTWLLRKDCQGQQKWDTSSSNRYSDSYINTWLNNDFVNMLNIKGIVRQVKIPYCIGLGNATVNSGSDGLDAKVFLLGGYEVGLTRADISDLPEDGGTLDYFEGTTPTDTKRISHINNSAVKWWLRSPSTSGPSGVHTILVSGGCSDFTATFLHGVRPAFIIPSDTYIDENNNILTSKPYNAISTLNVGDSVFCKENGVDTEYLLVHKGLPSSMYDASCNGAWLLRKDVYDNSAWNSSNNNSYKTSTIHSYLNNTFLNLLDIKDVIRQAKIPYVDGTGGSAVASGANGLSTNIFLLSGYEVGWTTASDDRNLPQDGVKLDYFIKSSTGNSKRIANFNGEATRWWLRSPITGSSSNVFLVHSSGSSTYNSATRDYGIRPAFIVPLDTPIDSSNNIIA